MERPSTSTALPLFELAPETSRGVAALHRDMLRVMARAPLWTVGIPVLCSLPAELLTLNNPDNPPAAHAVVAGTLGVVSYLLVVLATLDLGRHGRIEASNVWKAAAAFTPRYVWSLVVLTAAIMTGFMLLVVPGVLVMLRSWFITPAMLEHNVGVMDGLRISTTTYRARPALVVWFLGALGVAYVLPGFLVAATPGLEPWMGAVLRVAASAVDGVLPVATVLLFVEIAGPADMRVPVGRHQVQAPLVRTLLRTGRTELALAGTLGVMVSTMAGPVFVQHQVNLYQQGLATAERSRSDAEARRVPAQPEDVLLPAPTPAEPGQ